MAGRAKNKPQRIPPHQRQDDTQENTVQQADTAPPSDVPPVDIPGGAHNVANDAYLLQDQLTQLADHFEQLKRQLRESHKLASIGTTAAMLAHEFNNLFAPVMAYAQHALSTDDHEMMRKALDKTLHRTQAMRQMSDRLVGLARRAESRIKTVNVKDLIDNALGCLVRDPGKDNISVKVQIDPELNIRTDENQLLQVIFNLFINARQAMLGKPGRLTIDAVPTQDDQVQINVRDTGCGISPENLSKIFEPFFSTKKSERQPDKRGLGLGLSICKDIVEEELDGRIEVSSELNVGTTFTITLPSGD